MEQWLPADITRNNTLHELRGSPYMVNGIVHVSSYLPQDACDVQDYERRLNVHLTGSGQADDVVVKDDSGMAEKKRHSTTSRSNYQFWLKQDTRKILRLIKEHGGVIPPKKVETYYDIYPRSDSVIDLLSSNKNGLLFFDMETTYEDQRITCFAFAFDLSRIYVVPIIRHDYTLAYDKITIAKIFRALAVALRDNTTVAHNGAGFDFFVLARRYGIPIDRSVYDTMIAQHRIWPDVEKSLGHCISLWTNEPYHKDEACFSFGNYEQASRLWSYCGKDVATMIMVYEAQQAYVRTIPGMAESIKQANASIRPYLITTLQGIAYSTDKIIETLSENDRLLRQYLRFIKLLIGQDTAIRIRPKSKTAVDCMAMSNHQCVAYFHRELGYKVVGYGKTKKDGTKGPSLAEKNMLRLRLQYNNPVIDLILAYRQLQKESSSLQFKPLDWNKQKITS